jgi:hypothetical protein
LAQTSLIYSKTQPHAINAGVKRSSQRSFRVIKFPIFFVSERKAKFVEEKPTTVNNSMGSSH